MTETMDLTINATVLTCCHEGCGIVFAVPDWWEKNRRRDHTSWYCPNGHRQFFSAKTEQEKQIEALQAQVRAADANRSYWHGEAERKSLSLRATKGVLTRTRKRIAAGVCPCCHRSFQNVADHMATKHPDWPAVESETQQA